MGSDDRKKNKKKRSPSPSPSQDQGKSRKRHRREDDGDKKKSHRQRSSSHNKGKQSTDKHPSKHHKTDDLKGKFQELSKDDYFSKNNEFATWLKEEKRVFFSALTSESARELFSDFVKEWNGQKLESRYYEGIASGPRSAHKWAFKQ